VISDVLIVALTLAAFALVVSAALSPLETLSWWAGWTEDELGETPPPAEPDGHAPRQFIVYLSGVASISGNFLLPREKSFLRRLHQRFPDAVIVSDVFPYSPKGWPLLESPRIFERVWRRIQSARIGGRPNLLTALINMRNIFQVMVSADHRYGPIFNQGAASVIETALIEDGYKRGSGAAVAIIGYSGGAQVAVGAAPFLSARLKAPIDVISVGGVMSSNPGLKYVRRLHHIVGSLDKVERIGAVMFPDRWKPAAYSDWNAAKREGRIEFRKLDGMTHTGINGYFGRVPIDGATHAERTLEAIASMIEA
jgi:hypothetical protein